MRWLIGVAAVLIFWDEPASSVDSLASFLLGIISLIVALIIVVWAELARTGNQP
jgi:hypothetical protein